MLGLGGGCGAVGLLHEFPEVSLDIVEADPAMAAMAREFHPLVGHYERLGRLQVHVGDALDYLAGAAGNHAFVLADLAVNADSLGALDSARLVRAVAGAGPEVWFRVFGSLPDGELSPFLSKFAAAGLPVDWMLSPVSPSVAVPKPRDWVLAAGVPQLPHPGAHVPFARAGRGVEPIRAAYRKLLVTALPGGRYSGA